MPELALALQGGRLGVDPADQDVVAVEAAQVLVVEVGDVLLVLGVLDTLTLGGEHLHELGAAVADGLGDGGGQRSHGSRVEGAVHGLLRHRGDVVVAHRHSFSRSGAARLPGSAWAAARGGRGLRPRSRGHSGTSRARVAALTGLASTPYLPDGDGSHMAGAGVAHPPPGGGSRAATAGSLRPGARGRASLPCFSPCCGRCFAPRSGRCFVPGRASWCLPRSGSCTASFLAAGFFAAGFFATDFLATGFLAAGFFAAGFLTAGFFAAGFFAAGFLTAGFFATGFLAAGFFADGLLGGRLLRRRLLRGGLPDRSRSGRRLTDRPGCGLVHGTGRHPLARQVGSEAAAPADADRRAVGRLGRHDPGGQEARGDGAHGLRPDR